MNSASRLVLTTITKDRPRSLLGSLRSYLDNALEFGHEISVSVFDDSVQKQNETRSVIETLGQTYFGSEEKKAFIGALAQKSGIDLEIISFGLNNKTVDFTAGSNRNIVLLKNAGQKILNVDDDSFCDLWVGAEHPVPAPEGLVRFEIEPFETRELRSERIKAARFDLFGHVDGILGKPAAGGASPRLCWIGYYGDSAHVYPTHLLFLNAENRQILVKDESTYLSCIGSRQVHYHVKKSTAAGTPYRHAVAMGYDHSSVLPPFTPILKGEDYGFGCIFEKCVAPHLMHYSAISVRHDPPTVRTNQRDDIFRSAQRWRFMMYLTEMVGRFTSPDSGESTVDRLLFLGRFLKDAGQLSESSFEDLGREMSVNFYQRQIRKLLVIMKGFKGMPAFWEEDVQGLIHAYETTLQSTDFYVPSDLPGATPQDQMFFLKDFMFRYGTFLESWPTLFQAALGMGEL